MKKLIASLIAVLILTLVGCKRTDLIAECQSDPTSDISVSQTDPKMSQDGPVFREENAEFLTSKPIVQTDSEKNPTQESSASTNPQENHPAEIMPSADTNDSEDPTKPTEGKKYEETKPSQMQPTESATEATEPLETIPATTEPPTTVPPATEASQPEITYEFKRQVASYAVQYINAYRGSPCTVLPGMSQVAQYRASQLTWNYGHSTADKRAALAAWEYGRYIDATQFGDDASNSYWEADSAEAICAGFYGTDPEAMGKKIADLIRNSSGHWSYISSSEYSYIGVGVEYREGSEYGWYACVMVGAVDYG